MHSFGKITSGATFERTLPDRGHAPASIGQDSDGVLIICDVAADLLAPEVLPCRRPFEQMAVVPMPEAAIHKDDGPVTRKNQIGFSGQILRSEEHTSELQSLMRISYAVFCLKKKKYKENKTKE